MNPNHIAILVDSCTDVPEKYLQQHGMYSVPITIIYKDHEYRDKIDISAQEVSRPAEVEVRAPRCPAATRCAKRFNASGRTGLPACLW